MEELYDAGGWWLGCRQAGAHHCAIYGKFSGTETSSQQCIFSVQTEGSKRNPLMMIMLMTRTDLLPLAWLDHRLKGSRNNVSPPAMRRKPIRSNSICVVL